MNNYKEFAVGDIISTYHKGFYRLNKIEVEQNFYKTQEYTIFYYQQVLTASYKPCKTKWIRSCNADYCRKVDEGYFQKEAADFERNMHTLRSLLK